MSKSVSEQLVEMLVQAGVKRVYAVTGDSLNPVNDAIRRDGRIAWVHVRHEEAGAYAASAEAQLNGIACCMGSSGPGHVHLINGLYDAHRIGAPVIAIASTCHTTEFGTSYFQETNTIKLFDDCSYYNQVASTPHQFARMMQHALQTAIHSKGVAVVGLPGDVAEMDAADVSSSTQIYAPQTKIVPAEQELQALADILNNHEKITIYGGAGCKNAATEVQQLAGLLHAPVAYSYRGKMHLQGDTAHAVGMTGLLGHSSGYQAMHDAEVLLMLGTDFPYVPFLDVKGKIIQIDVKPQHLGRRANLTMGLCGNMRDTLQALLPLIQQKSNTAHLTKQREAYEKVSTKAIPEKKGETNAIYPEYIAYLIDEIAADDAIFTVDTGMCNVWGARYISPKNGREMLGSFNHGSMANALPMAIGAAFARPGKQIVAFCGDGGITMTLGDLMTIAQYKLPVKLVVFNNRALGMVKLEMQVAGIPDWQTDMVNPDFAMIAAAMGIKNFTINDPGKASATLHEAFAEPGAVLVNVFTDPNALAMPPHIEFDQVKGFALSMSKMIFDGRWGDVIDTVKSNTRHLKDLL
ncbi:pyruvate dehydrogenase (quinone) [Chitinophaga skermanii]|uniref:Pyruvate dehydrogenase (Quinone) n=1 Tax=Chitinophaga skermanii TaxID=331697 RepID=A0A327R2J3_9BACT|nr:thiamine pyrophosphate-dependent enzyme [Chitinophaga skermanii]RAJ11059.1 pyruvate dehydrogenase (quinone) [Chitinophaga skermanii]